MLFSWNVEVLDAEDRDVKINFDDFGKKGTKETISGI